MSKKKKQHIMDSQSPQKHTIVLQQVQPQSQQYQPQPWVEQQYPLTKVVLLVGTEF